MGDVKLAGRARTVSRPRGRRGAVRRRSARRDRRRGRDGTGRGCSAGARRPSRSARSSRSAALIAPVRGSGDRPLVPELDGLIPRPARPRLRAVKCPTWGSGLACVRHSSRPRREASRDNWTRSTRGSGKPITHWSLMGYAAGKNVVGLDIEPGYVTAVEAGSGSVAVHRAATAQLAPGVVRDGEVDRRRRPGRLPEEAVRRAQARRSGSGSAWPTSGS